MGGGTESAGRRRRDLVRRAIKRQDLRQSDGGRTRPNRFLSLERRRSLGFCDSRSVSTADLGQNYVGPITPNLLIDSYAYPSTLPPP